ncbi:MAG: CpaF family protein [Bacteriovoracaceae bacterium]|jgi:pilus assembly protein CpaF|nr:CpaF family protein [Bacteriovoracaceae bacterium]
MLTQISKALDKLGPLFMNENIHEIFVDAKNDIYFEEKGIIQDAKFEFDSEDDVLKVIKNLFKICGKDIKDFPQGSDLRLPDGSRAMVVLQPLALKGPSLIIRKFPKQDFAWDQLIEWGAISKEGVEIIVNILSSGKSLLIAGGVGSGKTTLANLITNSIPKEWRIIIAEKVAEMNVKRKRMVVLESANHDEKSFIELLDMTSKMRPDSIVINELKGKESAKAIELSRSGHQVLATIHSEDHYDALKRVELQCLSGNLGVGLSEIKSLVATGFQYVIYQKRCSDGKRRVYFIGKTDGLTEEGRYKLIPMYRYDEEKSQFKVI